MPASTDAVACVPAGGGRRRGAFTLVELLTVMVVLSLLAAILLPSLNQAFELAYATLCRRNLKCLAQTMHGNSPDNPLTLPETTSWTHYAVQYGSAELLRCAKDDREFANEPVDLSDVYILQYNHAHQWEAASVQAMIDWMNGGSTAVDPGSQIWVMSNRPSSNGFHAFNALVPDIVSRRPNLCSRWLPDPATVPDNQYIILVYDDCGIRVVFEDLVTIHSIDGEKDGVHSSGSGFYCNSSHYLVKGQITSLDNSKPDPEDACPTVKTLQHLTGANYVDIVDPPVVLGGPRASYGMNGQIEPGKFGPQQLMLMDADRTELDMLQADWFDHVRARHLGKVNVTDVSGAVCTMTPERLLDEYRLLLRRRDGGRSLWGRYASPGTRD